MILKTLIQEGDEQLPFLHVDQHESKEREREIYVDNLEEQALG